MTLLAKLKSLRPRFIQAAQEVYNSWDGDGNDPELGGGGICDEISRAIEDVLGAENIDSVEGGQPGDDHAFPVAYDDTHAYTVDIPARVYEIGAGYSWRKRKGVTFQVDHVCLDPVRREDIDNVEMNPEAFVCDVCGDDGERASAEQQDKLVECGFVDAASYCEVCARKTIDGACGVEQNPRTPERWWIVPSPLSFRWVKAVQKRTAPIDAKYDYHHESKESAERSAVAKGLTLEREADAVVATAARAAEAKLVAEAEAAQKKRDAAEERRLRDLTAKRAPTDKAAAKARAKLLEIDDPEYRAADPRETKYEVMKRAKGIEVGDAEIERDEPTREWVKQVLQRYEELTAKSSIPDLPPYDEFMAEFLLYEGNLLPLWRNGVDIDTAARVLAMDMFPWQERQRLQEISRRAARHADERRDGPKSYEEAEKAAAAKRVSTLEHGDADHTKRVSLERQTIKKVAVDLLRSERFHELADKIVNTKSDDLRSALYEVAREVSRSAGYRSHHALSTFGQDKKIKMLADKLGEVENPDDVEARSIAQRASLIELNPEDAGMLSSLSFRTTPLSDAGEYSYRGIYAAKEKGSEESVGWIELLFLPKFNAYKVIELEVTPEYKRRGLATNLYRRAVELARSEGREIYSYPEERSPDAEALHKKLRKLIPHKLIDLTGGKSDVYYNPRMSDAEREAERAIKKAIDALEQKLHDIHYDLQVKYGARAYVTDYCTKNNCSMVPLDDPTLKAIQKKIAAEEKELKRPVQDEIKALREKKKALAETAKVGMTERSAARKIAREDEYVLPRAECQVCAQKHAVDKGTIVHHGYERPGRGYLIGACYGCHHAPFPATDALEKLLKALRVMLKKAEAEVEGLPTLTKVTVERRNASTWVMEQHEIHEGDPKWKEAYESHSRKIMVMPSYIRADIRSTETRIKEGEALRGGVATNPGAPTASLEYVLTDSGIDGFAIEAYDRSVSKGSGFVGGIYLVREGQKYLHVTSLVVQTEYQRRGVATEMYRRALSEARARRKAIISNIEERSGQANKLHAKLHGLLDNRQQRIGGQQHDVYFNPGGEYVMPPERIGSMAEGCVAYNPAKKFADVFGVPPEAHLVPVWPKKREPVGPQMKSHEQVSEYVREKLSGLQDHPQERLLTILLDAKGMLLGIVTTSIGTLGATLAEPREIFAAAIAARAYAIIVAHNHPSGDPTPSAADIEFTMKVKRAGELLGIPVLDSLVIGQDGRHTSLAAMGVLRDM